MAEIGSGKTTVTTAGTRVPLSATSIFVKQVTIHASNGNTGNIFVGDVTVSSSNGFQLKGTTDQSLVLGNSELHGTDDAFDLNKIYIDSAANNESVTYIYMKDG